MRIVSVDIEHFRGIKSLRWSPAPGMNCLIGPGDSTKTSILDAIELCLNPKPYTRGLGSNGTKNQHKPYHLRSEPSSQASASIKQLRISASWLISVSRSCTVLSSASSLR